MKPIQDPGGKKELEEYTINWWDPSSKKKKKKKDGIVKESNRITENNLFSQD